MAGSFSAASEAISVLNRNYTLPGLGIVRGGRYCRAKHARPGWAVVTMVILVIAIDQFFWGRSNPGRPLQDGIERRGRSGASWLLHLWRAARLPGYILHLLDPLKILANRPQAEPCDSDRELACPGDGGPRERSRL